MNKLTLLDDLKRQASNNDDYLSQMLSDDNFRRYVNHPRFIELWDEMVTILHDLREEALK